MTTQQITAMRCSSEGYSGSASQRKARICVVEDDSAARFLLEELLGDVFEVQFTSTVEEFRNCVKASESHPDVVIADLRLPDHNLLDLLADKQNQWPLPDSIPVLVVSGMDDLEVVRKCFQYGAVDFITKPFKNNELIVKIERILKTANPALGPFHLDHISLTVRSRTAKISEPLTSKEFQIMALLAKCGADGVQRKLFIESIWGDAKVSEKVFDVHLFNLRKKLSPLGINVRFHTPNMYFVETDDAT